MNDQDAQEFIEAERAYRVAFNKAYEHACAAKSGPGMLRLITDGFVVVRSGTLFRSRLDGSLWMAMKDRDVMTAKGCDGPWIGPLTSVPDMAAYTSGDRVEFDVVSDEPKIVGAFVRYVPNVLTATIAA